MQEMEEDITSECKKLESVLDVGRYVFVIPPEQRPYAWDTWIVGDLLNDIKRAKDRGDVYYLLGSIVVHNSSIIDEVIDGQQRLTTLLMLYAALHHRMRNLHILLGNDESRPDRNVRLARFASRAELVQHGVVIRRIFKNHTERDEKYIDMLVESLTSIRGLRALLKEDKQQPVVRNTKACDVWLETIYLASVSADKGSKWDALVDLLTYLDEHVRLTVTTCTGSRRLAFKTFITCNSTGKPLTQIDLLKALLVQNQQRTDQCTGPARKWELLSTELDALEHTLHQSRHAALWHTVVASEGFTCRHLGAGSRSSRRKSPAEKFGDAAASGARAAIGEPPSLMAELLEHIRTVHDPALLNKEDQVRYFTEIFTFHNGGRPSASSSPSGGAKGIQRDPIGFVDNWLEPYGNALKGLLHPWVHLFILDKVGQKTAGQMCSVDKLVNKARNAVLELRHVPHDEWRTVVLAAINMVTWGLRAAEDGAQGTEPLERLERLLQAFIDFVCELQGLAVYFSLATKQGGWLKFNCEGRRKVYGSILAVLLSCKDSSMQEKLWANELEELTADQEAQLQEQLNAARRAVWASSDGDLARTHPTRSKARELLNELLTTRDVHKGSRPHQLPRALLLMAEDFGSNNAQPAGDLHIDHILPRDPCSAWTDGDNAPFAEVFAARLEYRRATAAGETPKQLKAFPEGYGLNRLGNLALVFAKDNAGAGNKVWEVKRKYLSKGSGDEYRLYVTTQRVAQVEVWNAKAIVAHTAWLVQRLLGRWFGALPDVAAIPQKKVLKKKTSGAGG